MEQNLGFHLREHRQIGRGVTLSQSGEQVVLQQNDQVVRHAVGNHFQRQRVAEVLVGRVLGSDSDLKDLGDEFGQDVSVGEGHDGGVEREGAEQVVEERETGRVETQDAAGDMEEVFQDALGDRLQEIQTLDQHQQQRGGVWQSHVQQSVDQVEQNVVVAETGGLEVSQHHPQSLEQVEQFGHQDWQLTRLGQKMEHGGPEGYLEQSLLGWDVDELSVFWEVGQVGEHGAYFQLFFQSAQNQFGPNRLSLPAQVPLIDPLFQSQEQFVTDGLVPEDDGGVVPFALEDVDELIDALHHELFDQKDGEDGQDSQIILNTLFDAPVLFVLVVKVVGVDVEGGVLLAVGLEQLDDDLQGLDLQLFVENVSHD